MKKILFSLLILSLAACAGKPNANEEFHVRGNCDMCKERIEKTALAIKGVSDAEWHEKSSTIIVAYDSTVVKRADIEKAIAATGHATQNVPMDKAAHAKLPECCQEHAEEMH